MTGQEERVQTVACDIARGEVMTYGEIARVTGLHPRQVGRIVSRIADDIAWWRIVRADGTPAQCHEGRAAALLRQEGIPFTGPKVDWRVLSEHSHRKSGDDKDQRP